MVETFNTSLLNLKQTSIFYSAYEALGELIQVNFGTPSPEMLPLSLCFHLTDFPSIPPKQAMLIYFIYREFPFHRQ